MLNILAITFVWLAGIVAMFIMRKLDRENKTYFIWAIFICVAYTIIVLIR